MKKNLLLFLAFVAIMMSSCRKTNVDELLQTIPQNTRCLAIFNTENLKDNLGKEGVEQLRKVLSQSHRNNADQTFEYIFSGDSEIDLSAPFCIFEFNNALIITCALKDEGKFRSELEEKTGIKFEKEKDIYYLADHTIFVSGKQTWITSGYPEVQPSEVNAFIHLPKSSSMAGNEYVTEMINQDADIASIMDIREMLASSSNMSASLWLNMAFRNPQYLASYVNFEKGSIIGDLTILNDKYKPAAFSLRPSNIDVSALKKFNSKGNLFVAAAFDSATISKIISQIENFAPIPPEVLAALKNIDGTMAVSSYINSQSQQPGQVSAMITFKDNASASSCASFLTRMMADDTDEQIHCQTIDNMLLISSPGELGESIGSVANSFDGAGMGLVFDTTNLDLEGQQFANAVSRVVLRLVDNGDSSTLRFNISTTKGQNSLITLLQFMNYTNR